MITSSIFYILCLYITIVYVIFLVHSKFYIRIVINVWLLYNMVSRYYGGILMIKIGDISRGIFRENDNASCYINFYSFGNFFESKRKNSCLSLLFKNNSFWKKVPVYLLEPDEMKVFEKKSNEKIFFKWLRNFL